MSNEGNTREMSEKCSAYFHARLNHDPTRAVQLPRAVSVLKISHSSAAELPHRLGRARRGAKRFYVRFRELQEWVSFTE